MRDGRWGCWTCRTCSRRGCWAELQLPPRRDEDAKIFVFKTQPSRRSRLRGGFCSSSAVLTRRGIPQRAGGETGPGGSRPAALRPRIGQRRVRERARRRGGGAAARESRVRGEGAARGAGDGLRPPRAVRRLRQDGDAGRSGARAAARLAAAATVAAPSRGAAHPRRAAGIEPRAHQSAAAALGAGSMRNAIIAIATICAAACAGAKPVPEKIDGLRVTEAGSGGVPVVFLHRLCSDRQARQAPREHLRGSRRVVAYDQRGQGESDRAEKYTLDLLADDLDEVANRLHLEKFWLVGHSMSGAVLSVSAGHQPEKVPGLALVAARGAFSSAPTAMT